MLGSKLFDIPSYLDHLYLLLSIITSDENKAQPTYTGTIVGGSIGGFVAGILVSLLGMFLYWRFCGRNG